jgi:hypothetical protein
MTSSHPGTRRFSSTLALCLAVMGAASMLYYHEGLFMPRALALQAARNLGNGYSFGNDFYQVWLTAREWFRHGRDPYSLEMTREIQVGLYGRPLDPHRLGDPVDTRRFPYPVFTDLLFWPTAEFPFTGLRVVVVFILSVMTVASVLLWLRALRWRPGWRWMAVAALLTMTSYPALEGLYAAQLGLLVAYLLAASMLALQRNRLLMAGILLALTTIKPQVTALTILYLLIWSLHDRRRRTRFLIGFFSTFALLLGSSLLALPHWIPSWIHTVLAYHHYTAPPVVTQVLTAPLGPRLSAAVTLALTAASVVLAVVLCWRNRAAPPGSFAFWLTVSLLLSITTITILPGQAIYDHIILFPGILLLVRARRQLRDAGRTPRMLLSIGALVLFWPWVAAFALLVLRPWLTQATFNSTAILSLPIRTAASLPFAVLALLAWLWRISPERNQAAA